MLQTTSDTTMTPSIALVEEATVTVASATAASACAAACSPPQEPLVEETYTPAETLLPDQHSPLPIILLQTATADPNDSASPGSSTETPLQVSSTGFNVQMTAATPAAAPQKTLQTPESLSLQEWRAKIKLQSFVGILRTEPDDLRELK